MRIFCNNYMFEWMKVNNYTCIIWAPLVGEMLKKDSYLGIAEKKECRLSTYLMFLHPVLPVKNMFLHILNLMK